MQEIEQLSESELEVWQDYYQEQPFGMWRDDFRSGLLSSVMANTVSQKSFKAFDFMPFYPVKNEEEEVLLDGVIVL